MSNRGGNNGNNNNGNNNGNNDENNNENSGWETEDEFIATIEQHLENGGGIDDADNARLTYLHDAAENGFLRATAMLLEKGAFIDAETAAKETPLQYAVLENEYEIVKLLIEKGADKNKQAINGFTALHMAVKENNQEMVKLLLDNGGVNTELVNSDGITPLQMLCEVKSPNLEILELLVRAGANIDAEYPEKIGLTPLHSAIKDGQTALVSKLLELGANKEARLTSDWKKLEKEYNMRGNPKFRRNFANTTPLLAAVQLNNPLIVQILLNADVDKNAELPVIPAGRVFPEIRTNAIHLAIDGSQMIGTAEKAKTLEALLDAGVKMIQHGDLTPLQYAVNLSRESAVRLIVSKGFDIDEINVENTNTALSFAINMSMPHMIDVLLELGASIYPKLQNRDKRQSLADLARAGQLEPRMNRRILEIIRRDPDGQAKYIAKRRERIFNRRHHALAAWGLARNTVSARKTRKHLRRNRRFTRK